MTVDPRYSLNVFWSSEDDAFIATSPEFPRLSGFGSTVAEALQSMEEVLGEAIATYREEGWPLPEPYDHAQFSGKFQVRLSRSQHAELTRRADAEGVSMNALVTQYVSAGLSRAEATSVLASAVEERIAALLDKAGEPFPVKGIRRRAAS
ncbi:MAG TPA: type II toxin-antitoxin system HicB family antitoxin [Longimicrobiaceae bacterium]|nr:type II toxin-antitoxin system HicB family antitoxin [Longimicrobiaceae bacterium]